MSTLLSWPTLITHQSRLVSPCGPAKISVLTAFVVLIFREDVTARQGGCVRAATGGCTVATSAVTDSLELSVVVSSARRKSFYRPKRLHYDLRSVFDFFGEILLNSVFHDHDILSINEAKKLRKLYTQNLAMPTHYGTDLPQFQSNHVIKYPDNGFHHEYLEGEFA